MKTLSVLAVASLFLFACSKNIGTEEQAPTLTDATADEARQRPQASEVNFTQQNLFPEGVVYDKFNDRFYVSSTTRGDIGIVGFDGSYTAFITDPDLIGTTGLEIDEARKLLYVCNSSAGSVGVYDINTGARVAFYNLKALLPNVPIFVNDIALDPQGNAYATNSASPVIYKISRNGSASIFYQDAAFATTGFGFNGIEYGNSGGGYLLVAFSARNKVVKFPVSQPTDYNYVTLDAALANPDGLLLSQNGKELIVVNNAGGANGKVIRFSSNNKWQSASEESTFEAGPVFPTTATTTGKSVYVLYAYLNRRSTGWSDYTVKRIPGTDDF